MDDVGNQELSSDVALGAVGESTESSSVRIGFPRYCPSGSVTGCSLLTLSATVPMVSGDC